MIIELPEKFNYGNQARIEDGILKIPSLSCVRAFMYKLTLAQKGKACWYCGKKLKSDEITMDHLYPQDLGGPTIPNNLAPTCALCNNKKSNLTEKQYRQLLEAPENKKKTIKSKFLARNEQNKIKKGSSYLRNGLPLRKLIIFWSQCLWVKTTLAKNIRKLKLFTTHTSICLTPL